MEQSTCPGCGCSNPSTEHLMWEYNDLAKGAFNTLFGANARKAQDAVARLLLGRGVTSIPNFFGPIAIRLWEAEGDK